VLKTSNGGDDDEIDFKRLLQRGSVYY